MSKFIDQVTIELEAGNGGDGKVAWRKEKYIPKGGPAGGDGGNGGSIWFEANNNINTLLDFRYKYKFKAKDGENGGSSNKSGKGGEDLTIQVPVGTIVKKIEHKNKEKIIADLFEANQKVLIAKGGKGGRGNQHFATSVKQAPHFCEPGQTGESFKALIELKLVAHIGIIGMPNAGKSTLISKLSACKPEIANYAFTTITPNLGIMKIDYEKSLVITDIPGLIQGASEGKGLGIQFLKHIERTKTLIHLIDGYVDSPEECWKNYQIVIEELRKYNPELLEKKQINLINKIDSLSEEFIEDIKNVFNKNDVKIDFISSFSEEGFDELKEKIIELDKTYNLTEIQQTSESALPKSKLERDTKSPINDEFLIKQENNLGAFRIISPSIEGLVRVTNFSDLESVNHLFKQLKRMNLLDELKNKGIKSGDTVLIGSKEMVWSEFAEYYLI
ncbi:MAG: GTPase ObgE [Candidatus Caenarcaniphilales bacterium]|nr:GTPase ObgE [Candidatus Caenarcaniphilales bacterium]